MSNGNETEGTIRVQFETVGESLTKQSDALDADINNVMARHVAHRIPLPNGDGQRFMYGDFSDMQDFRECVGRVNAAVAIFEMLPADVRKNFGNDPAYVFSDEGIAKLKELGLVKPAVEVAEREIAQLENELESEVESVEGPTRSGT